MSEKGDANLTTKIADITAEWTRVSFASLLHETTAGPPGRTAGLIFDNISSVGNATDTGNGSEETRPDVERNDIRAAFTVIACTLIIIGTVLGNTLICSAVAITRKLRTPSNLLIVSLAISDLLVGALDMPFAVMYEVTGTWSIGEVLCDFWTSIDVLFCTASILNICVISIDRYLVITKPFDYAMKRTPLRMILMIGLVWIVSAIISIPPLFGWKKPAQPNECMVSQDKGYQFFATIGAFYLPLVIMVVIYSRIYLVSYRMNESNPRRSGGSSATPKRAGPYSNGRTCKDNGQGTGDPAVTTMFNLLPPDDRVPDVLNGGGELRRNGHLLPLAAGSVNLVTQLASMTSTRKRSRTNSGSLVDVILRMNCRQRGQNGSRGNERKATRTLGVIMGAFVACWLPFFILALIRPFCHDPVNCIPQWLNSLLLWLGYTNSLLNPVIYARFNREFRTPFKYILQCRCANINSHLRFEEFTEQFGRLQMGRHSSLFPSSLPKTHPPPTTVVVTGRTDSLFPPLAPLSIPSPSSPSSLTPSSRLSLIFTGAPVSTPLTATSNIESHLTPTSQSDSIASSRLPPSPSDMEDPTMVVDARSKVTPGSSEGEVASTREQPVSIEVGCSNDRAAALPSPPSPGSHSSIEIPDCVPVESQNLLGLDRKLDSGESTS